MAICAFSSIQFYGFVIHRCNFDQLILYIESKLLHDSFEGKHVHSLIFYCKAFHRQGLNLNSFFCSQDRQLTFIFHIFHKDRFFADLVFYGICCIHQYGIFPNNDDIHSLTLFHKFIHTNKMVARSRWYHQLFRNSMKPCVFSCKVYISQCGNFFRIYGYGS